MVVEEMNEFKKGQIVYVSDNGKRWHISHYAGENIITKTKFTHRINPYYERALKGEALSHYEMCLSVEDYQKMLNEPKDKDLVWCWDTDYTAYFLRSAAFYDAKHKCVFVDNGKRGGVYFDNYEVIPREHWPQWAIEAYKHLED